MKQILNDSLTNFDGQYSSKKLTTFVCLAWCLASATLDQFGLYKVNMEVWQSILLLAFASSGLSIVGNKISPASVTQTSVLPENTQPTQGNNDPTQQNKDNVKP